MLRRALWSVLVLTAVVAAGGCWDRREIESLAFVTMSAVDRVPEGGGVIFTTHVAKPIAVAIDEPGALEERPFWIVSASGRTVGEAHLRMREESPRTTFWAHNMHVVVGQRLAEEGLEEIFGFFVRDFETRRRVTLMVFDGEDTREFMQAEFDIERLPAVAFREMLANQVQFAATAVVTEVQDFLVMLETEGLEPVVGTVRLTPRPPEGDIRGDMERDEVMQSAITSGAAVFRDDRLQGLLDSTQTRGLQWARGEVRTTKVIIPHPSMPDRYVSIRVTEADARLSVDITRGVPSARVEVDVDAEIVETTAFIDPFTRYETLTQMQRKLAGVIKEEVEAALRAAQGYGSDVFGFGQAVHCRYPREWQSLRDGWNEVFAHLTIQVEVKAVIRETGLLMRATRTR